jgi:hypothetical protein
VIAVLFVVVLSAAMVFNSYVIASSTEEDQAGPNVALVNCLFLFVVLGGYCLQQLART